MLFELKKCNWKAISHTCRNGIEFLFFKQNRMIAVSQLNEVKVRTKKVESTGEIIKNPLPPEIFHSCIVTQMNLNFFDVKNCRTEKIYCMIKTVIGS